ncbi:hypothetical protein [Bacillus alkalicellulosilyticus]|nr:hypothetical protein [Bacillus alkalicellulosilyticus]
MDLLFLILIFTSLFAIYDSIRRVNNNILNQTEELKKIREAIEENNKK